MRRRAMRRGSRRPRVRRSPVGPRVPGATGPGCAASVSSSSPCHPRRRMRARAELRPTRLLPEFQRPPLGRCFLAGSRPEGFLARGSLSPGPFPPCGSGRDRVRPPSQLRGSEGFAPSSLTCLGSVVSYVCVRTLSIEKAASETPRHGAEEGTAGKREVERVARLVVRQVAHLEREAQGLEWLHLESDREQVALRHKLSVRG